MTRIRIHIFFAIFGIPVGNSQDINIDSLENVHALESNDSIKVTILDKLWRATIYSEPLKANTYIESAISI